MISHNWSPMKRLIWLRGSGITGGATYATISGNPVSFTSLAAPLRKLQIAFSPVQEGSGDPSPDNVRPISGWSSLTVEQRGKNLLKLSADNEGYKGSSHLYTLTYGTNSVTMTPAVAGALSVVWDLFVATENMVGMKLSASYQATGGGCSMVKADVKTGVWSNSGTNCIPQIGYTITADDVGRRFGLRLYNSTGHEQTLSNVMVNIGATADDFVPYNPSSRSISISLGSTVYSGWVDAVSGIGEVTMASVDLGTLTWTKGGTSGAHWRFSAPTPTPAPKVPAVSAVANALCSVYRAVTANQTWTGAATGIAFNSDGKILIADENYADETALTTALTGQTLVYELATPIPISLTPQEINSLAGDNVLFSDANGDLTVEYRSA